MSQLLLIGAIILLVAGVAGSLLPGIPGGILSAGGVLLYAVDSSIHPIIATILVTTALTATAIDLTASVISAKAGGASTLTAIIAGVTGVVLFFIAGLVGTVLGITAVVFVSEYAATRSAWESLYAAGVTTLGMLASNIAQAVVTATVLVATLIHLVLF
jgi:Protein of unknown function (DUF456).